LLDMSMTQQLPAQFFSAPLLCFALACGPPARGYPLYDASRGVLPLEQVAQISGEIIAINGKPVTQSTHRFELLPGCYVLRMTGAVSYSSAPEYGGMRLYLGEHQFALHTEAGHRYYVELDHSSIESTAPAGKVQVQWVVTDIDPIGKKLPPPPLYVKCP
jgi:hypothetical protein